MTSKNIFLKGIYHDKWISPNGTIVDLGWRSNIVVDRCRILLAAFMKGDSSNGIQVMKVGRGEQFWDDEPPEPPVRTIEQLTDPSPVDIPIGSSLIEYLDATGSPTEGPTHQLRISVMLEPGMPPVESEETSYPMREFGLFGQYGAQEYMIDYVRHPVIHKQAEDSMERTIHLIF